MTRHPQLAAAHPYAIAMWDFSWLERRWPGGGYEDWARALDELVERGYDAVRIDAYPHLYGLDGPATLKPVWTVPDWGSPTPLGIEVRPAFLQFVGRCKDRGIAVALSSWFREDVADRRMAITSPTAMAAVWTQVLAGLDEAGLIDTILYVDLCNEFPLKVWAPFMYPASSPARSATRTSEPMRTFMRSSISLLRDRYPGLPFCYSFCQDIRAGARDEDVSFLDLLELHLWFVDREASIFDETIGFDLGRSKWDPSEWHPLAGAQAAFEMDRDRWLGSLIDVVGVAAAWSERAKLPVATTECWGPIHYKDGPGLDWRWVREAAEVGVRAALATGRWVAIATSNFCGPQFRGMWADIAWHQELTTEIRSALLDAELRGNVGG
jgi:hypothetical protein